MMNLLQIAGIAVCAAVVAAMLRRYHQEYAVLVGIAAGAVILLGVFAGIAPALRQIEAFLSASGLSSEYGTILFKTLGICFLAQFSADSCRDAGENALAFEVELAGKISVVVLSLPLFGEIAKIAVKLIGG